jgi:hypothetical protein
VEKNAAWAAAFALSRTALTRAVSEGKKNLSALRLCGGGELLYALRACASCS